MFAGFVQGPGARGGEEMVEADPGDLDGGESQGPESQGDGAAGQLDQEARGTHPHRVQDSGHGGPLLEMLRLR